MGEKSTTGTSLDDINARLGDGIIIEPRDIVGNKVGDDIESTDNGNTTGGSSDSRGAGDSGVRYNKDGSIAKKRGRKAGSGGTASRASTAKTQTPDGISSVLFSLHAMAASFVKVEELAIDKKEADMLASAINDVQKFYDVQASAEVLLWVNVFGVAAAVYGPRIAAVMMRKRAEKESKPRPAQTRTPVEPVAAPVSNIYDFPPAD